MELTPLNIAYGDVVAIKLVSPLIYSDGRGGEELRSNIRLRIGEVSGLGITGMGADNDMSIVPSRTRDFEKIELTDHVDFFPWSAILRMNVLDRSDEYERRWDEYDASQES